MVEVFVVVDILDWFVEEGCCIYGCVILFCVFGMCDLVLW